MDQKYKFDKGKPQYRLIPPAALRRVADVLTYGAEKYSAHTWVNVESVRYLDATFRHIEAFRSGHRYDAESKMPHLAMAITNLMFLLERQEWQDEVPSYYEEIRKESDQVS